VDNIPFNTIPVNLLTPGQYIEVDASKAVTGLVGEPRRMLLIAPKLAAGEAVANDLVLLTGSVEAERLFGRGSVGHLMARKLFAANPTTECWAIAVDDAVAGVAATATISVSGTATESYAWPFYVAGVRLQVPVSNGDTAASVAAAIAANIAAQTDLPVTAVVNGVNNTQVDLTARNDGEPGNEIDIRTAYGPAERNPAGLNVTIDAMSGGSGNPDISALFGDVIADEVYQTIVMPFHDTTNVAAFENWEASRWDGLGQLPGHLFVAVSDTHANLVTYGDVRNSAHVSVLGVYDSPTPAWEQAAAWAGVVEYHGAIDPARPFQTLPLPGVLAPPAASRPSRAERNVRLDHGISTTNVGHDGSVYIERVVTTYQNNASGIPDSAFLDLNTVWTLDAVRFAVRARIALRYPRHKLANDGTNFAPGQPIVTPNLLRAELIGLMRELEEVGLVENLDQFKADLQVVRSSQDPNRVNAVIPPDLINQFRIFAAAIQFRV